MEQSGNFTNISKEIVPTAVMKCLDGFFSAFQREKIMSKGFNRKSCYHEDNQSKCLFSHLIRDINP